jgi:hypothetical protein
VDWLFPLLAFPTYLNPEILRGDPLISEAQRPSLQLDGIGTGSEETPTVYRPLTVTGAVSVIVTFFGGCFGNNPVRAALCSSPVYRWQNRGSEVK